MKIPDDLKFLVSGALVLLLSFTILFYEPMAPVFAVFGWIFIISIVKEHWQKRKYMRRVT
jgi:uncharacterized membrane protein